MSQTSTNSNAPGASVLVAEDNPMNQRVIGAFLKSLGVAHVICENGQEAIDHLCEADYALVLMDIQMPVLDGITAIRLIRSGATPRSDIPVVVVTANAMACDRDTYLGAGADGYLPKPFTLDAMRTVLDQFALLPVASAKVASAS